MRTSEVSFVGFEVLIAKSELLFPADSSEESIFHIEAKSDELSPHGKRVNTSVDIVIAAEVSDDDEIARMISEMSVDPKARSS